MINSKNIKLPNNQKRGIVPRIIDRLYTMDNKQGKYLISFYIVSNDKVFDLLQPIAVYSVTSISSSNTDKYQFS